MKKEKRNQILLVVASAIGLFLVNNIVLGAYVPKLPGGSATGITTMTVITWISLKLKKTGVIPAIFLIYGLIGLPSHLMVGDTMYFMAIILLVFPAIIYDLILKMMQ